MRIRTSNGDRFVVYSAEETQQEFVPIRDRIFFTDDGGFDFENSSRHIFRDVTWPRVIIRGGLVGSDRTVPPFDSGTEDPIEQRLLAEWRADDPRDELQPLFDLLVELGVPEIVQMSPDLTGESTFFYNEGKPTAPDAVTCAPVRDLLFKHLPNTFAAWDTTRLIFDRTGRWGYYSSAEEFGLIGGDEDFIARYIEKAGGMNFVRERADVFWNRVLNNPDHFESVKVARYYELAGWGSPPTKRES